MLEFLAALPTLPISPEIGVLVSGLIISTATALIVLIRNRGALRGEEEADDIGNMGAILDNPASLMPHLVELRNRIIYAVIALGVGIVAGWLIADPVLRALAAQIDGGLDSLIAIGVTEPFRVYFRIAIVLGVILAFPYIVAQLWVFIGAGLKQTERRVFYLLFPFAVALFITGVTFAYIVMLPVALPFLINFGSVQATPTLDDFVRFVTAVLLAVGLSFEMPLISFALSRLGIINAKMLAENWRIAVVGLTVFAAIVTPTPDPLNMALVVLPLCVLYVLSIGMAALARRGRAAAES
ncbi:MAG: twin-arginine translocase subunit TatC [Chloroflexi bacterium]|nr:twin-arginine translocase subunit TatC [Chloroflexota bacterium]